MVIQGCIDVIARSRALRRKFHERMVCDTKTRMLRHDTNSFIPYERDASNGDLFIQSYASLYLAEYRHH